MKRTTFDDKTITTNDNIKKTCVEISELISADRLSLFDKVQQEYLRLAEKERGQLIPYILSLDDIHKTYIGRLDKSVIDNILLYINLYLIKYENRVLCLHCKFYGFIEYYGDITPVENKTSTRELYNLISCNHCKSAFVYKKEDDIFIYKCLYIIKQDNAIVNSHIITRFEPRHKTWITFISDGNIIESRFNIY